MIGPRFDGNGKWLRHAESANLVWVQVLAATHTLRALPPRRPPAAPKPAGESGELDPEAD
jgi:hypothetical protein